MAGRLFCLTLTWSGARITEVLRLSAASFDLDRGVVAIVTLKRRRSGVVREVILPPELVAALDQHFQLRLRQADPVMASLRLWPCCRQTGWRLVKRLMRAAGVPPSAAMPKGLRHGFAVAALQALVPAPLVQRWLGHASLRTTAIYSDVAGDEERGFAGRMWQAGEERSGMGHLDDIVAANRKQPNSTRKLMWRSAGWVVLTPILASVAWLWLS